MTHQASFVAPLSASHHFRTIPSCDGQRTLSEARKAKHKYKDRQSMSTTTNPQKGRTCSAPYVRIVNSVAPSQIPFNNRRSSAPINPKNTSVCSADWPVVVSATAILTPDPPT